MTCSESHWAKLAISCWISSISSSESSKSGVGSDRSEGGRRAGRARTDLFDGDYLFGLVVYCLVDRAKAARTELFEQGILTCGIAAGNRAWFCWNVLA